MGRTAVETVATVDVLGRDRLTAALANLLRHRQSTDPLAIGMFGHWGTGKSSQVRFVQQALAASSRPRFVFAEFNAWRNERSDNLAAAMAQSVVEALVADLGFLAQVHLSLRLAHRRRSRLQRGMWRDASAWWAKTVRFASTWTIPLIWLFMTVAVIAGTWEADVFASTWAKAVGLGGAVTAAWLVGQHFVSTHLTGWFRSLAEKKATGAFALPDFRTKLGTTHEIGTALEDLCSLQLKGDDDQPGTGDYLLLVVDDLDRCGPEAVKEIFDAIRLVAHLKRVVVVVLIDERIAFAAVEKHYSAFADAGRSPALVARDYLAKVFQVSLTLPTADSKTAEQYIRRKLFKRDVSSGSTSLEDGGAPDVAGRNAPDPGQAGIGAPSSSSAPISEYEVREFIALAAATGIVNPRELWRMKQSWLLLRSMALQEGAHLKDATPWLGLLFDTERRLRDGESLSPMSSAAKTAVLNGASLAAVCAVLLPSASAASTSGPK